MGDMATYTGETPVSKKLSNSAVARGLRVAYDSTGAVSVAAIGVRGDFVTMQDGVANQVIEVCPAGTPAKVPAVASEAVAIGDTAYSAANGQFSKTATSAVLMGKWEQAAGIGELGEVRLMTVL